MPRGPKAVALGQSADSGDLERGAFTSTAELEAAILACIAETNADPKPFVWTKTADSILASAARFCLRTSNSGH